MSYRYYPSPSSGSVEHVRRPATDDGRGSYGPVLVVLAVVSFLSVAACIAGRVCGRGSSASPPDDRAEKAGFGATQTQLAIMRPVPCSRATVHDLDDAFEIKLLPPNPAGARETAGGAGAQAQRPGPPRQFAAASSAAGTAGFRGPPRGNGGAVRPAQAPPVRSGVPSVPAQRCK